MTRSSSAAPPGTTPPTGTAAKPLVGDPAAAQDGAGPRGGWLRGGWRQVASRAVGAARLHWLATALLAAGLAMRVLALIAYHPALLYVDTLKYLYNAWPGADPLGYKVILKVLLVFGDLGTVAVIQHLLGLAIAAAIYVLLVRREVPRWLAAIAMGPVLLDAYQLQAEQTIMPDIWFEAFAVAGLVVLLWRPELPGRLAVAAGLILGSSALVRQIGEVLILPALAYLLCAIRPWRQALRPAATLTVAFLVPIVGYSGLNYLRGEHFGLSSEGSIMGRIAASVDCATLKLPAAERPLCPTPSQQANGADWLEHSRFSPLKHFPIPPGMSRNGMISAFDSAVERQQPLRIVASYLRDTVRIFALTKDQVPGTTPIARWRFQANYPRYLPEINVGPGGRIILGIQVKTTQPFSYRPLDPAYGGPAQVDRPVAAFLRSYQLRGGYAPGPLLALFTLAGLGGSALALAQRLRRRQRRRSRRPGQGGGAAPDGAAPHLDGTTPHEAAPHLDGTAAPAELAGHAVPSGSPPYDPPANARAQVALACLLFCTAALGILGVSDIFEFSWRYQLPVLVTLPPAGALGAWAVWRARRRPAPRTDAKAPGPA